MSKAKNEVWKIISEVSYVAVSPNGGVRTLDRVVPDGKGGTRLVRGRILKQHDNGHGYLLVQFRINGKFVGRSVHRLVAKAFIPNPENLPEVNHKNGDVTCNCVSNLEWCSREYNIQYREKYGISAKESATRLPVFAVKLDTLEVSSFPSQIEASRVLRLKCPNINKVIKNQRNHTGGYWFTNANNNAIESTRAKFGGYVADKVEEILKATETK